MEIPFIIIFFECNNILNGYTTWLYLEHYTLTLEIVACSKDDISSPWQLKS